MSLQLGFMLKMGYKTLFAAGGTDARLTLKRSMIVLFMAPWYVLTLITNWICLLLDEVIFYKYRRQEIVKPLFVLGCPRSGTTFLHRLIAGDDQFTTMKTWEILFAPSIVQKRFWLAVARIDKLLGSPLERLVNRFEKKILNDFSSFHKVGLFEPEEDDAILINIFASYFIVLVIPFMQDFRPFIHFDEELSGSRKKRIMGFYKKCVQRHLYVFGRDRYYLSKNPAFSSKIEALNETFPDCRIICTVRTPLEVVPSTVSFYGFAFNLFCSPVENSSIHNIIHDMLSHWYRYPLKRLTGWPEDRHVISEYRALVADPMDAVLKCYERLGYMPDKETRQMLNEEKRRADNYRSRHVYKVDQYRLTLNQVAAEFTDIIQQFGFNTAGSAQAADAHVN